MNRLTTLVLAAWAWAWLALGATPALARDVYLNGIKLDASVMISNQNFPSCEVRIDDKGDVFITAKGFKVDVKDKSTVAPVASPAAALEKRYWLISKQPRKGMVQYEVDVFVNGKHVKKVRSSDDPVVLEVTRHVKPGANRVQLVARKVMGDKRLSSSPTDTLEIILGEGTVGGGTISITKPIVTYARNAQETQGFTDESGFDGR